jgi:hypothetical protein
MLRKRIFDLGIVLCYLAGIAMLINSGIFYYNYIGDVGIKDYEPIYRYSRFLQPGIIWVVAIAVFMLTYFGLRKKLIWTWFLMLLMGIFVPLVALVAQIMNNLIPFAIPILIFSIPGTMMVGPYIFESEK